MAQEIERKFLVKGDFRPFAMGSSRIVQGYLSSVPERTVRVRIRDDKGYLTVKGAGNKTGASRFEWEKEIPVSDAEELLKICEPGIIDKVRYIVPAADELVFEVDEFHGDNEGLLLAEIELPAEDHPFKKPGWLGEEVTGDKRYYNSMLKNNPFKSWK
jgi:adenylate cyclase